MPVYKLYFLLGLFLVGTMLSACASYQPDTRYLESEQRPVLQIPPDMNTPNYNEQMLLPAVKPATAVDGDVDTSDSTALERPPQLDDAR